MVKWSPSAMGMKHRRSTWTLLKLYPPFLERECRIPRESKEASTELDDTDSARRKKRKITSTVGDTTIQHPEERFAEIRDTEDYQWWEDGFEEEGETDRTEGKKETELLWRLERCKTYYALGKPDEKPDTTDPYLSHELYLPYSLTPKARNFTFTDPERGYEASALPRRPRSPVRTLLPGKFDLSVAYEERNKKRRVTETKERLREAKDRISQSIKQLPFDQPDMDLLISSLVVQAICEEVTMTLMNVRIDTDIHAFVNAAVVWALRDMDVFEHETILVEEEFLLLSHFRFANFERELEVSNILMTSGSRRMLLSAFRAPFSRSNWATLHRHLPWSYVCPSHEKGHTKFYPNIHERINEALPKEEGAAVGSYVPDLTCYHFGDVSDKSHVAYKRKSKFAVQVPTTAQIIRAMLTELENFVG
ncbi:uncharacterized protein LOC143357330 [Halictus rubicundus]|uniref:uncharacterized protein LOC143357330 n=1 Tax=Halictus rubicundus TaxID=77578 RepID=UPI004036D927